MNILGIDTTSKKLNITLTDGRGLFLDINLLGPIRTSKSMIYILSELLELGNLDVSDIDGVSVIKGPGSFTGLKLGMTMAKLISYIKDIPLVGVTLFDVIRYFYRFLDTKIEILLPSRRNEFYYDNGNSTYTAIKVDDLDNYLDPSHWIYVPTVDLMGQLKDKGFSKILPGWDFHSYAHIAALLGEEKLRFGQQEDPFEIEPLYIRKFPF